MTGKTEKRLPSTIELLPQSMVNGLRIKKALSGLGHPDEQLLKKELDRAERYRLEHEAGKPGVLEAQCRNFPNLCPKPTKVDKLKRIENITTDIPIEPDSSGPKMSLPKEQVTQMRNRAKNKGSNGGGHRGKAGNRKKRFQKGTTRKRMNGTNSIVTAPANSGVVFSNDFVPRDWNEGGVRIIHNREPVGALMNTTTFGQAWMSLNPGDTGCFPWLSKQAAGYEKYKYRSLRFMIIGGAPTTTQGQGIVYPDYDVNDEHSTTITAAMQNRNSTLFPAWDPRVYSPEIITPEIRKASPLLIFKGKMESSDLGYNYPLYNAVQAWYGNNGGSSSTQQTATVYVEYIVELLYPTGDVTNPGTVSKNVNNAAATASPLGIANATDNFSICNNYPAFNSSQAGLLLSNADDHAVLKTRKTYPPLVDYTNQRIWFVQDFEGLLFFQWRDGVLTGESGSNQLLLTPSDSTKISFGPNPRCYGSGDSKLQVYSVKAEGGYYISVALNGFTIDTTCSCDILAIPCGDGSFETLGYFLNQEADPQS